MTKVRESIIFQFENISHDQTFYIYSLDIIVGKAVTGWTFLVELCVYHMLQGDTSTEQLQCLLGNTFKSFTKNTMKTSGSIFNFWDDNQLQRHPKPEVW